MMKSQEWQLIEGLDNQVLLSALIFSGIFVFSVAKIIRFVQQHIYGVQRAIQ